ncbi:fumarylacetoacetate hydrolase family protein [Halobacterium sp. KA-6]|uniref:fumarylacetoacetate hydrolase family protein n=1 Tax=Halobacterium sp. KA-6 TaxID=2896368 RepID=UPI001E339878|nr:fumarylacetoacetate hydrolase family protein [Halobacterium sp. KA-6]MCD2204050.1 fumarylacetoacetate hydrolase family protein [Halobacterium sp. KA-6]
MQFVRYTTGETPAWGVLDDNRIHALDARPNGAPLLAEIGDEAVRSAIQRDVENGVLPTNDRSSVSLLAPVPSPGKIICAGLNYHDHAEEQNEEPPEKPMLFTKSPSAVANPGDAVIHPEDISQVDYEVELAAVVGRTGSNISKENAEDYVAGYTVLNDVSARDAQFDDGQFFRGKSYDTFAPMGPTLVAGDGFNANSVNVELRVNGKVKQASNTDEFIFDIGDLISYISGFTTLCPGDVISTGTPGGVGIFRDPPELLEPGDNVEAEIEGIGVLKNNVVAE